MGLRPYSSCRCRAASAGGRQYCKLFVVYLKLFVVNDSKCRVLKILCCAFVKAIAIKIVV